MELIYMADLLIYRGPHWMEEDDNGSTKYETLQLFIDNYKSGSLTPAQKYKVIRYLVDLGNASQINKVISLLQTNNIPLNQIETKKDLTQKLDSMVKNWSNINTTMRNNILSWADDVIDLIPQSVAIAFKDGLAAKYANRYQLGLIIGAYPDGTLIEAFSPENKCSPLNVSGLAVETAQNYIKSHRIAFENTPQLFQDRIANQEMFSVSTSQILPYLEEL